MVTDKTVALISVIVVGVEDVVGIWDVSVVVTPLAVGVIVGS